MRHLLIFLLALMAFTVAGYSQSCLPDGITFKTQWEVDNFPGLYPGCTSIAGDVTIHDESGTGITNLNGLSQLTSIGGKLYLLGNKGLINLQGLHNLTSIGTHLDINGNDRLKSLSGLQNLSHIGGRITLANNDSLQTLTGLEKITKLGGVSSFKL